MIWDGIEWDGTRVEWQDRVVEDNVGGEKAHMEKFTVFTEQCKLIINE